MINRAELKELSKQQIKGNIGMLFVCSLLIILASGIAAGINMLIPVVGSVASVLIMPPLSLGMIIIYIGITCGKKAEINDLFKGFNQYGNAVLLYILVGVFTFLWTLLFIVPGIIKGLSYSMAFYVLAEHPEMSAREALNESKRMMEGRKWELFVLQLSFILWGLLGSITFGLAYIYVAPYIATTTTNFYHRIKGQPVFEQPVKDEAVQM